ncbi:hypothetical protein D3C80_965220 [compost metagenome]
MVALQTNDGRGAASHDGEQLQGRRCDDAHGALGADEQLLQVIAGVVLAQPLQAIEDLTVRHDRLNAQHQVAHHAVAQDGGAAGIGRDDAADGGRAFGSQAEGEEAVLRLRQLLGLQ